VEQLQSWTLIRLYNFHRYANQALTILIGVGIGGPFLNFLSNGNSQQGQSPAAQSLGSGGVFICSVMTLLAWGLFKYYLSSEEAEKKFNLIKTCQTRCNRFHQRCIDAIQTPDPMPVFEEVQQNISEIVNLCRGEGAWPGSWKPFPKNAQSQANATVDELIKDAKENVWKEDEQKRRPKEPPEGFRAIIAAEPPPAPRPALEPPKPPAANENSSDDTKQL
jgi:hypothetical protein